MSVCVIVLLGFIKIGCDYSMTELPETTKQSRLRVTPNSATLALQGQIELSALFENGPQDTSVSWVIEGSSVGALVTSGLKATYTAPLSIASSPTSVVIRVRSIADTSLTAMAVIQVLDTVNTGGGGGGGQNVTIALTPLSVTMNPGKTQRFTATVSGSTNTGVIWRMISGPGSIASDGLYSAPMTMQSDQASAVIEASALADPQVTIRASINIIQPVDPNLVCFERDVLPIFIGNCSKCHGNEMQQEGYNFTTYEGIFEGFEDDDEDENEILEKITEEDDDDRMPPPPNPRLTSAQISMIRKWIEQGALNTKCSTQTDPNACDTINVSYVNFVKETIQNNCIGCHASASGFNNNVSLADHASVSAIANDNGRLLRAIDHSGQFKMPKGGVKLDDCSIAKIRSWINQGARNN